MNTTNTITIDGTDLFLREDGDGEPLFLLHGLPGTGDDWAHVFDLDALSAEFRVVRPDARGHGRSTNPSGEFGFRRCALDLLALMDRLRIDRIRAVGMSLGAKTLLHVATEAPGRVEAMVLVSATPRFPDATRALMHAVATHAHADDEWTAMRALHVHGDEQIRSLWRLPARLADDPNGMNFTPERLSTITARTLIVSGDRDSLYPVELAVELYRGIRNASLYVVPGGGHGPIVDTERARFAERALAFLRAK
jgi:pimeloyl-ACP methyl ester carboxylesterase